MGSLFGGAPKPKPADTSHLDEQREEREREKDKLERENKGKRRNLKGRGAKSLLTFDTLKGVESGRQKKLG